MSFSVLMSVYKGDNPDYLKEAISSTLDQTVCPGQLVIVGDGPLTDAIRGVIEDFSALHREIEFIALKENVGLGAALNAGLKQCRYELVARMDADDVSLHERFERQMAFFHQHPGVDLVGSWATEIDESGTPGFTRKKPLVHEHLVGSLWSCPLIHPSVMFRKKKIQALGGYNPALPRRQDYELWFRAAAHGMQLANIGEPLLLYRFSQASHKKQSVRMAFEQALIGYRGSSLLRLAWWKRLACFVPFFRALFPNFMQHYIYTTLRLFNSRKA